MKNMKVPYQRERKQRIFAAPRLVLPHQKPGGKTRKQKDNGESLLQAPRITHNSKTSHEEVRIGDEHGMLGKRSQTGQWVGESRD